MVLSDSEQEFSLWQTQPEIQQLAAIIAAVKGKGRKKGGSANGGARNSPRHAMTIIQHNLHECEQCRLRCLRVFHPTHPNTNE
jgi:hypothetical protein